MSAEQIPSELRGEDLFHHIDMGFSELALVHDGFTTIDL